MKSCQSALCQYTAPETVLSLCRDCQEAWRLQEANKKIKLWDDDIFFRNFTVNLSVVALFFHPNMVISIKRKQLGKGFISTVGSSHVMVWPVLSNSEIPSVSSLEDVWSCHHACSIHPELPFFMGSGFNLC